MIFIHRNTRSLLDHSDQVASIVPKSCDYSIASLLFIGTMEIMPELPEVETVRQQLKRKVIGKKIASLEVFHRKSVDNNKAFEKTLFKN